MSLKTPIGFLIFNRPDLTQRVFREIARARPEKLFVVGDGPRSDHAGEREQVLASRAIIDQVDWPCEVFTNYSDENLGCKDRIVSGLAWIFGLVEDAIILEDDCLPEPTFFSFCEDLLDRYREDDRIVSISGNNFQFGQSRSSDSYYFSKYFHCWGWASWRRVWENFDPDLNTWPAFKEAGGLKSMADTDEEEQYWDLIFSKQHQGEICSWAFPWTYSCVAQSGLSVIPEENLVSNIGFDDRATHTLGDSPVADLPTKPLEIISHPQLVVRNKEADLYTLEKCFQPQRLLQVPQAPPTPPRPHRLIRLKRKVQRHLPAWCRPSEKRNAA